MIATILLLLSVSVGGESIAPLPAHSPPCSTQKCVYLGDVSTAVRQGAQKKAASYPDSIENDTGLTCGQIRRLGLKKFTDHCFKIYKLWQDETAYILFVRCQRQYNQKQLQKLKGPLRDKLAALYTELARWEDSGIALCWSNIGGGTAIITEEQYTKAKREEAFGHLLQALSRLSRKNSTARKRAASTLRDTRQLAHLIKKPSVAAENSLHDRKQDWLQAAKEFEQSALRLETLLAKLPDGVAGRVASRMQAHFRTIGIWLGHLGPLKRISGEEYERLR